MATLIEGFRGLLADVPEPGFVLVYESKDITADVSPDVLAVTYTDYLNGQSDELEIELDDTAGRWVGPWYPEKGARLTLKMGYSGQAMLSCGVFEVDEVEYETKPAKMSIRALGAGISKPVRTRNARAYENVTLAAIIRRVAKRNRLTVVGQIADIRIDHITQYRESDLGFITRLAREYGYAVKVAGQQLVFTAMKGLRTGRAVATLQESDIRRLNIRDKIKDVVTESKVKYHNPKTKQLVVYGVKDGQVVPVGTTQQQTSRRSGQEASADTLKLSSRSGSKAVAQAKAEAAMDRANLQKVGGTIDAVGNTRLVAGNVFLLPGYGRLSGRYLIESARHRMERGGGYAVGMEVKRVAHGA